MRMASEHRAALDWLNDHTDDEVHFFGVEVSVVRIGDSVPAPVFTVVSRSNEWQKLVRVKNPKKAGVFQNWELAHEALRTLRDREWTSIGSLAELIGTSPGWIGRHFYERRNISETLRMFTDNGSGRANSSDPPTSRGGSFHWIPTSALCLDVALGERCRPHPDGDDAART